MTKTYILFNLFDPLPDGTCIQLWENKDTKKERLIKSFSVDQKDLATEELYRYKLGLGNDER